MKWIGQHIYDQIARFRSDVFLEDISTGTIASGAHLGLDSNNKIVKAADGGGDLTSIVAGTGLSGTSLTGPIPTLNVDAAQAGITSLGTLSSLAVTSASDLGSAAMTLTNADVDQIALDINASNTTANVVDINASAVTSANAIKITRGNSTGTGSLDSAASSTIYIDQNQDSTASSSNEVNNIINVDYDTAANVTGVNFTRGVYVDINDTSDNSSSAGVYRQKHGFHAKISKDNTHSNNFHAGFFADVSGAGPYQYGGNPEFYNASIYKAGNVGFFSKGESFAFVSTAGDDEDYFGIKTTTNGATKLVTSDYAGAAAHFEIETDGDITLDANGDIKLEPKSGGSILLDGTIDIDAGVVTGATSITSTAFVGDLTGEADTVATIAGLAPNTATTQAAQTNITSLGALTGLTTSGAIELGHATDTTLARSAAGVVTIEGNQIVTGGAVNVASGAQAPVAMMVARRTITQAEMNALHTTPIEIIPAPGANKVIVIVVGGSFAHVDRAATNSAVSTLGIGFDGFIEAYSVLYARRFVLGVTTDSVHNLNGYQSQKATVLTNAVNKKIEAKFFGACTNNSFTSLDLIVNYYILDLS